MITEHDLEQAITECQGERNPNAQTCMKLAAFYTIRNEMFGNPEQVVVAKNAMPSYSYADAPEKPVDTRIEYDSDTDFSRAINGREADEIWKIMDELMTTIQVLMPKLYYNVMQKLNE